MLAFLPFAAFTGTPKRAPARQWSDAELVEAMAQGDSDTALEAFYQRFGGLVMAVAQRILGSSAEAEEVAQEIVFELWRRAPQYESGRAAVSTWVATVARSRCLDAIRARNRRPKGSASLDQATIPPAPADLRPDEMAAQGQRRDLVRAALAELNDSQREVLELSYFAGLSHGEIAKRLEVPLGTVKSRILSGMRTLRRHLSDIASEEDAR